MSRCDFDQLSPSQLIAQYVLECRGDGLFLPYADYAIIDAWLAAAANPDDLLLILSEVLPSYFKDPKKAQKKSLRGASRKVLIGLRDQAMRGAGLGVFPADLPGLTQPKPKA